MTELESFFVDKKEGTDQENCIELIRTGLYNHTYYTHYHKIPIPETQCNCMDLHSERLKPRTCRGDCSNKRPFFVLGLGFSAGELGDVIDNFTCNVDYSIVIGGNIYETNRVLTLCLVYHLPYVLIYVDQPNMPNEILLTKTHHYYPDEIRRRIVNTMNPFGIIDRPILYTYGMAQEYKV